MSSSTEVEDEFRRTQFVLRVDCRRNEAFSKNVNFTSDRDNENSQSFEQFSKEIGGWKFF